MRSYVRSRAMDARGDDALLVTGAAGILRPFGTQQYFAHYVLALRRPLLPVGRDQYSSTLIPDQY